MKKTYEIMAELKMAKDQLYMMIEETEGEINEGVQQVLDDIENLNMEASAKIEAINWVYEQISERKSVVDGVLKHHQDKVALYKAKMNTIESNEDRLKTRIIELMQEIGVSNIDYEYKNIKLMYSKSLVVDDQDLALKCIPEDYKRIKVEIDKTGLKKHIENTGVSYEGVGIQEKPYLRGL